MDGLDGLGAVLYPGDIVDAKSPTLELRTFSVGSFVDVPDHWTLVRTRYSSVTTMANARILPRLSDLVGHYREVDQGFRRFQAYPSNHPHFGFRDGRN